MIRFDNTFARELDGLYVPCEPDVPSSPTLVMYNDALAEELGLDPELREQASVLLSGARVPEGAQPLAQAYAGHQFGGLSPQLGDGRAHLLGEVVDQHGQRRDLQLKGSGRTLFSRGGDGKAALGPMLREYVLGEAMHALGVPTSRMLAVVATGEPVYRETPLPGAVLTRVASSHLRVGTFEFFAIRQDTERLRRLLDYTLARHFPDASPGTDARESALALIAAVRDAQARLVAKWMGVGFIHGVLNTDNVALSGETIDYGPCAFMDAHDPAAVFSSIDHHGRYAYGNQPAVMGWNLSRLAVALLPLLDDDRAAAVERVQPVVDGFEGAYQAAWGRELGAKLGWTSSQQGDRALADELFAMMTASRADHTLTFRRLADAARGEAEGFVGSMTDRERASAWLERWQSRLSVDGDPVTRSEAMDRVNPVIVPRNHRVEEALDAASGDGDLAPLEALLEAVSQPFEAQSGRERYAEPAPEAFTSCYQTFCGT